MTRVGFEPGPILFHIIGAGSAIFAHWTKRRAQFGEAQDRDAAGMVEAAQGRLEGGIVGGVRGADDAEQSAPGVDVAVAGLGLEGDGAGVGLGGAAAGN